MKDRLRKLGRFLSRGPIDQPQGRPEARTRNLHLGVDYGTSTSKLVLTDYSAVEGERSFVVRPLQEHGGGGGCRIPSIVSISGERIRFGFQAAASFAEANVYRSLKMLCAYPDRYYGDDVTLPAGLDARDLATLFVGHLIQLGQDSAQRYAKRFGAEPQVGLTLGAPMAQLDDPRLSAMFVEMARQAHGLGNRLDLLCAVSIENARRALSEVRQELAGSAVDEPRALVRSEAEAALFWAYRSPDIEPGRYACVDVGAGTTSASWFHINATRSGDVVLKDRLSFYGAACRPPACDAIDAALAIATEATGSISEMRGREDELIKTLSTEDMLAVNEILAEIADVFGVASKEAFRKEESTKRWRESCSRIFFLGGGSRIGEVRQKLIARMAVWLRTDPMADPGLPSDLTEEDGGELCEDPVFLLVAYGLARRLGDVPDVDSPNEVPNFRPTYTIRERVSTDDLYS